ncbi:MAG: NUDIX hydrolase [Paracoccus sp. (in: a-proteobacteria)]|uniref:NUDIX hydrolase n=1 Tax=Paracoccus sp. TaxID=267 RepID=UPI0040587125
MTLLGKSLRMLVGKRPPALQVGALCLRPRDGKVLMITSRGTGRWIIPKGWPMPGHSLAGAAGREAWEEAGAEGRTGHRELGRYIYDKVQDSGFAVPVEVHVFPLHVDRLSDVYPESGQRHREWFAPGRAAQLVAEPGLAAILRGLGAGADPKTDTVLRPRGSR